MRASSISLKRIASQDEETTLALRMKKENLTQLVSRVQVQGGHTHKANMRM